MKKKISARKRRLRFEQMEGRLVLSAAGGLATLPNLRVVPPVESSSAQTGHYQSTATGAGSEAFSNITSTASTNWSGYAALAGSGQVTSVSG